MMRIVVIVGAICATGWYYFIGGAQLDEAMVRKYYADEAHATLTRNPEALCKLYASKLVLKQETVLLGQSSTETLNRQQACEGQKETFKAFEDLGDQVNGILTIEYEYNIEAIEIAPNRKSAIVRVTNMLNMGNGLMVFKSVSTDELTRQWGNVLMLKADAKTNARMNLEAMANPGEFLKEQ